MLDKIKQQLPAIRLGKNQKSILMGAAAILVTGAIIFSLWRSSQGYTALFGSQEHIPVTQVVEVLDGEAIAYRINPDNGQILVAENQLGRARILLAAKGITATLPTGYELMDQETMLGSSQFIQNVRYKRSLEGELAQSIMALTAVDYARVHLGMSEASSFAISNRSESSASVILRLKYGQTLKADQVGAIVQLVAGSIPGMKAANVRVVDQHGELLSEAYQANGKGVANVKNGVELAHYLQSTTEKSIANLLSSVVGVNNYRISVATQLDLSRIEETLERYGAEPRVSDENIQQENGNEDMAMGIPGSLSNQPSAQPKNANAPAMMSRSQAQRKYAYDRDIRHVRHPGFKLEKMTVAVILNKSAPALEKWTPEQLNELKRLIEDAAGIIITMQSIDGSIALIGVKVAAALIGTFLGVFICYCLMDPMANAMEQEMKKKLAFFECVRMVLVNHVAGKPSLLAVDAGRKMLPLDSKPTFATLDSWINQLTMAGA
ncbi:flagellar M-ring protein [Yersinia enterocolitica]|nr:flagellar M-ring protein [Yersinia enterocolitica]